MATAKKVDPVQAEMERLKAELAAKTAELAQVKSRAPVKGLKVSEKGGVSLYGIGRFPATFYKEQWEEMLAMKDEILAFLKENDGKLRKRGDKAA